MDEPTASLNNEDIESLFKIMRNLKNKGVNYIYITKCLNYLLYVTNILFCVMVVL